MAKPFTVSFDKDGHLVMVRVVGKASHEDHCSARDKAIQLCSDHQCSCLMVDLRDLDTEKSSTLSCLTFGQSMATVSQPLRFALVLPEDAKSAELVTFTSNVIANRGKTTKEFRSIEEAERWLTRRY